MTKLKKTCIYVLNLPLYWLALLLPKDKKIWIFGAWFGEKYADNSKYLFEYVNQTDPKIRAIWLTNNKETINLLKNKNYEVYYTYSVKGYYYSSRAFYSFITTGFSDVNKYIPATNIINLWHGIPLKKIVYDDRINSSDNLGIKNKIKQKIFHFIRTPSDASFIIASSYQESKNLSTAFRQSHDNILITGLPRNDIFFTSGNHYSSPFFNVIYMPTHRNEGELDISNLFIKDLEKINKSLHEMNVILHIKLHFYHLDNLNIQNKSNVIFLKDIDIKDDIYSIINNYDILITDYSSIYFDYLLTGRPIIFAPFDLDEYLIKNRELYYDYNEVAPGPKCGSWSEVLHWIGKFQNNPSLFSKDREIVKNQFHKHQDGRNCERVYQKIIRL